MRCTVRNTGTRAGDEVVQLYVRDVLASVARPILELKGFQRLSLIAAPRVRSVSRSDWSSCGCWIAIAGGSSSRGAFRILIGASSKDIRLRGELIVK